jgi:hypothetical protein
MSPRVRLGTASIGGVSGKPEMGRSRRTRAQFLRHRDRGGRVRDCSDLEADRSDLARDCFDLEAECSDLERECSILEADCSILEADCSDLEADCSILEADCFDLEADCFILALFCFNLVRNDSNFVSRPSDIGCNHHKVPLFCLESEHGTLRDSQ